MGSGPSGEGGRGSHDETMCRESTFRRDGELESLVTQIAWIRIGGGREGNLVSFFQRAGIEKRRGDRVLPEERTHLWLRSEVRGGGEKGAGRAEKDELIFNKESAGGQGGGVIFIGQRSSEGVDGGVGGDGVKFTAVVRRIDGEVFNRRGGVRGVDRVEVGVEKGPSGEGHGGGPPGDGIEGEIKLDGSGGGVLRDGLSTEGFVACDGGIIRIDRQSERFSHEPGERGENEAYSFHGTIFRGRCGNGQVLVVDYGCRHILGLMRGRNDPGEGVFYLWILGAVLLAVSCLCLSSCANQGGGVALEKKTMVKSREAEGICFLRMKRKFAVILEQDSSSAGALIDGRYVLTAAHGLYDPPSGKGDLRRIQLAVGRSDVSGLDDETADCVVRRESEDMGRLPEDQVWSVAPEYQARLSHHSVRKSSRELVQYDYGFVDLGRDFGRGNSFQLGGAVILKVGDEIRLAGYPGESKRVKGATGQLLFEGGGTVTSIQGSFFGYDLETSKGVSGGPIWVRRGGRRVLVGIHLGSDLGGIKGAVGRVIDEALLDDWRVWVARRKRS